MNAKDIIPSKIRLAYKLTCRNIADYKSGNMKIFARSINEKIRFEYSMALEQPIRQSHLFENKIFNLRHAGKRIENIVIRSGEMFSFWKIIGDPTKKNGYKKGRNLISEKLTEDYGGGICQLSGIIYHIAITGGLEIIERHNHSIDIYKEEERYTPLGADATVVYGYKDLRIKNNKTFPIKFKFLVHSDKIKCALWSQEKMDKCVLKFERKTNMDTEEIITKRTICGKEELIAVSKYKKQIIQ